MLNIFVLILVAIIITATTSKLKELVNSVTKKEIKSGLIIATVLGIISGIALQIGITESIAELFGGLPELPEFFSKVDIGLSCIGLSAGSGFFIKIYEQFKSDSEGLIEK